MNKKIVPSKKVREDIVRRYNKDPEGWGAFVGRDKENYISSIFMHKSDMWAIKEFAINPYRLIGCGTRTRCRDKFNPAENYPFGLRPLTIQQGEEFRNGNFSVIEEVLSKNPISGDDCGGSLVIGGPVMASNRNLIISSEQEKLDLILRKSLNSLISRKYPGFRMSYL